MFPFVRSFPEHGEVSQHRGGAWLSAGTTWAVVDPPQTDADDFHSGKPEPPTVRDGSPQSVLTSSKVARREFRKGGRTDQTRTRSRARPVGTPSRSLAHKHVVSYPVDAEKNLSTLRDLGYAQAVI